MFPLVHKQAADQRIYVAVICRALGLYSRPWFSQLRRATMETELRLSWRSTNRPLLFA
jgi:hypothetical protein